MAKIIVNILVQSIVIGAIIGPLIVLSFNLVIKLRNR